MNINSTTTTTKTLQRSLKKTLIKLFKLEVIMIKMGIFENKAIVYLITYNTPGSIYVLDFY